MNLDIDEASQNAVDSLIQLGADALLLVDHILTQHLLEDGVSGQCEYQDALMKVWIATIEAGKLKKFRN